MKQYDPMRKREGGGGEGVMIGKSTGLRRGCEGCVGVCVVINIKMEQKKENE